MSDFIACTIRSLPDHLLIPAAREACRINPANAPALRAVGDVPLPPAHIAVLTGKYWGAGGVHLSISFLDSPPADLRARILAHANAWGKTANVKFSEVASGGQVRIARTPGQGYWSYLGTDVLQVPAGQPTMNLDSFTTQTPDGEFYRVVRHEVGHTLGFPHEHLRQELVQKLDVEKTVAYFLRYDGWSRATTMQQVLTPISQASITGRGTEPTAADQDSIMCYQLPGSITVDGQPIRGGADIDAADAAFAAKIYPSAAVPPAGVRALVARMLADPAFAAANGAWADAWLAAHGGG
jgi:hypothetical protein